MYRRGSETGGIDRSDLEKFASDIRQIINKENVLMNLSEEFQARMLEGEAVQEEVDNLFSGFPPLLRVSTLADAEGLGEPLDLAAEEGFLEESERESFDSVWEQVSWLVPGARGYIRSRDQPLVPWTHKSMEFIDSACGLQVEHIYHYGVEERRRIRAPAQHYLNDVAGQLLFITKRLHEISEEDGLDEEVIEAVSGLKPALKESIEASAAILGADISSLETGDNERDSSQGVGSNGQDSQAPGEGLRGFQ